MDRTIFEDEHNWFRESVKTFVDREIMPNREKIREQRIIDREIWLKAGEAGFLGLGVPSEYGGSGTDDFRFNAVFGEELARAGVAFGSSFGIQTDIVAPYLIDLATDEQKQRWMPKFCTGEYISAIGMTEPNAGSDLAAIKTTAKRDGEGWVVNGSKTFITNGYQADLVVTAARTEDGISLFMIEEGMPGFNRGRKLEKIGQHEADTAELFFEDVAVPPENLLGELNKGFVHMMERLAQERLSSAVGAVGHSRHALDITLEYAKEREAFGRPIGSFQHNRFKLAEMVTELDVAQVYVDHCIQSHVDKKLTAVDAAKAKWWCTDLQGRVLDQCLQLHGGYGFMEEYDVARGWADARIQRIWAGTNEIMKEIIGRSLGFGDPRPKK
ncbi:MAG TPA: acyl-CoA dehydrogenase family protein [Solirubrobacterales bacterium]|jgi:alkylation response protein AidB-like acyl-CoA dehydrogenase|nr:acyl-CoA dehydrogenase family protein [Solirubrobacterales bacterium]